MKVLIDGVEYVPREPVPKNADELDRALELAPFGDDAGPNVRTLRQYLCALLLTLWDEGEGFSGKRPFGNGGWSSDILIPLVEAGFVKGKLIMDEGEFIDYEIWDDAAAEQFVSDMIVRALKP